MRTPVWTSPLSVALAIALAHCGSAQEQGTTAVAAASASSNVPGPDDSPFVPRTNDPICGAGHKWVSSRCVAGEGEAPGASEKKTASLARGKPGGDSLVVDEITVGTGREVRAGDIVKLHYVGTLADGTTFDSSRSSGPPFEFRVGQGQVIKGFDRGVLGMKVGGRRKITIPYQLGYGTEGSPPRIPPRATLIFDLELLDVM